MSKQSSINKLIVVTIGMKIDEIVKTAAEGLFAVALDTCLI